MKRIYVLLLSLLGVILSNSAAPNLAIRGSNFGIEQLVKDKQIFYNRTTMPFGDIPSDYVGWSFVKINANSSWQPGPLPSYEVKADGDGFLYAMVADYEKPDVCAKWATDNGWQLIPDQVLSYSSTDAAKFHFYKKSCSQGQWVNVVQPATFSGAVVIAPAIAKEEANSSVSAVAVNIVATNFMEASILNNGTIAYANRSYVFNSVKTEIAGLNITRYNGGAPPKLKITVLEDGDMYIAQSNQDKTYDVAANGWTQVAGYEFKYNDPTGTTFTLYKKTVKKDDYMEILSTGWQGILVLSSKTIDYKVVVKKPTPPPGVVIHNSKATTKKFVGSPSITVLKDGTYLASHDYFGGIISDAFVYKSVDKGLTWERISEIKTLNWAKLFTRGEELYLMGVAPKGTQGYGNVVVMRSYDGGHTWTVPADSKTGLLMEGYYTCAPTPVLFHNGRIWKAMENQGKVDGWGPFGAFMMSVKEDADLLDASNWTISNELQYVAGAVNAWTWLEGNAVVAKDGSIVDILRLHYDQDDKAAVINVSNDGKTITYNPQTGISNVPGACKKFTINYDSISGRYWTLSNYVLPEDRGGNLERTRNTIALCWSEDLVDWTVKDILLHADDIATQGFQYVDWLFDGEDIIAVVRTAWADETGNADSQHNANYLTFHRFRNFRYEKGAAQNGVSVKRWYKDAKSAIALTFDDGFKAHYDYAYPILKEYNIPATFFVNSGNLVHNGEVPKERYGFWENFREMSDNGYEVASHSVSHPDLTKVDYDVLLAQLANDKKNIENNIGRPCLTHAYPSCLHNDDVNALAAFNFIAARACGGIENNASLSGQTWYGVQSDLLGWIYPRSLDNENTSFVNFKTGFENTVRRNRNFGVLCIHEVLPFELLSTSTTYEVATTEWLRKVCDYVAAKQATGDIWPATFANIVRYAQERDNLRVNKTFMGNDSVGYSFTTWLDPVIFNHPLSFTLTPPAGWSKVKCEVREGNIVVFQKEYNIAQEKVSIDVVPDRQQVVLSNLSETSSVDLQKDVSIFCYPIPAEEFLNVECGKKLMSGTYKIYNLQGSTVLQNVIQSVTGGNFKIHTGNLPPGLYLLHIEGAGVIYNRKFLKK
mgnify:CR=1 FL=1